MGYITVDLLAFSDPSINKSHSLFWAIGLDCYMNNYTAAAFYFHFLMQGKLDQLTGAYTLVDAQQ